MIKGKCLEVRGTSYHNNSVRTKMTIPNPLDVIWQSPSLPPTQYVFVYNRKLLQLPFSKCNTAFGKVVG